MYAIQSASSLARCVFRGPRARALFAGLAAHSIVALDQPGTSAIGLALAAAGHTQGWPIPRGGSQQITEALASLLRSLGGIIESGAPVNAVEDLPPARALLLDLTPRQALKIASHRFPGSYARRLSRLSMPGDIQGRLGARWSDSLAQSGVRARRDRAPWRNHRRDRGGRGCGLGP